MYIAVPWLTLVVVRNVLEGSCITKSMRHWMRVNIAMSHVIRTCGIPQEYLMDKLEHHGQAWTLIQLWICSRINVAVHSQRYHLLL